MALLDRLTVDLNFDARGVKAGLQKLDQGLAQARTRMGRFADGLAGGAARIQAGQQRLNAFAGAALGVGVGITAGLFKVGQAVVGFEQQLNELNAVLGNETPENMAKLEAQAKRLGATTQKSASDAAAAQTELARAGFTANQVMAATPSVLNLAIAGNLDMGTSAMMVGAALKSYGFDADQATRVTDVFASTAANSAFNVAQIGPALRVVAPLAKAFGVSFEQTMAMLGTLQVRWPASRSRAGTALRNIIAVS